MYILLIPLLYWCLFTYCKTHVKCIQHKELYLQNCTSLIAEHSYYFLKQMHYALATFSLCCPPYLLVSTNLLTLWVYVISTFHIIGICGLWDIAVFSSSRNFRSIYSFRVNQHVFLFHVWIKLDGLDKLF